MVSYDWVGLFERRRTLAWKRSFFFFFWNL